MRSVINLLSTFAFSGHNTIHVNALADYQDRFESMIVPTCSLTTVRLWVENGAVANGAVATNAALMEADRSGRWDIVEYLRNHGARTPSSTGIISLSNDSVSSVGSGNELEANI
jgi:hypothetical protein